MEQVSYTYTETDRSLNTNPSSSSFSSFPSTQTVEKKRIIESDTPTPELHFHHQNRQLLEHHHPLPQPHHHRDVHGDDHHHHHRRHPHRESPPHHDRHDDNHHRHRDYVKVVHRDPGHYKIYDDELIGSTGSPNTSSGSTGFGNLVKNDDSDLGPSGLAAPSTFQNFHNKKITAPADHVVHHTKHGNKGDIKLTTESDITKSGINEFGEGERITKSVKKTIEVELPTKSGKFERKDDMYIEPGVLYSPLTIGGINQNIGQDDRVSRQGVFDKSYDARHHASGRLEEGERKMEEGFGTGVTHAGKRWHHHT